MQKRKLGHWNVGLEVSALGLVPYSPLGKGFLTGIGTRHEATHPQVALAGLLSRHAWIVPIPGTTKLHRL